MSGFRKFRSSLHRRRRSIEAVELGYLMTGRPKDAWGRTDVAAPAAGGEGETAPLEFSPSLEAREIGPNPIAWLKPKRHESDN